MKHSSKLLCILQWISKPCEVRGKDDVSVIQSTKAPNSRSILQATRRIQGYLTDQETHPSRALL